MHTDIENYMLNVTPERKATFMQLYECITTNLPKDFEACIQYKMPSWVVPHSLYSAGYHCDPKLPLPFLSIASQKGFIALYHMGLYANTEIYNWFVTEYPKYATKKLDMGKSCIRFKYMDDIPWNLLAELFKKFTVNDWIEQYTQAFIKK